MSTVSYVFGIVAAAFVLIIVIDLLRRRLLRERHAAWWLGAGLVALVLAIFPDVLAWLAGLLGIAVPVNLVFFGGIAVLFLVALQASSELTRLEDRTRTLAERVALLQLEVDRLNGKAVAPAEDDRPSEPS